MGKEKIIMIIPEVESSESKPPGGNYVNYYLNNNNNNSGTTYKNPYFPVRLSYTKYWESGQWINDSVVTITDPLQPANPKTVVNEEKLRQIVQKKIEKEPDWELAKKGAQNLLFGTLGAIASGYFIVQTGGTGAALGGGAALMLCIGEATIGVSQLVAAFSRPDKKTADLLNNSGSIPGLIAYGVNSSKAQTIDAFGQILPGMLTGGNIKGAYQGVHAVFGAAKNRNARVVIYEGLSAYDAGNDVWGFTTATIDDFGNDIYEYFRSMYDNFKSTLNYYNTPEPWLRMY